MLQSITRKTTRRFCLEFGRPECVGERWNESPEKDSTNRDRIQFGIKNLRRHEQSRVDAQEPVREDKLPQLYHEDHNKNNNDQEEH